MGYQIKNDRPLQVKSADKLGRRRFADDLAKIIVHYVEYQEKEKRDGLVIGLEGEWGSGKTSLINFIKDYLSDDTYKNIIVKDFNSWMTTDKNSLLQEFFTVIVDFYKEDINVRNIMKDYAKSFLLKSINVVEPIIPLPFIGSINIKKIVENVFMKKSLTQKKQDIDKKLQETYGKWLIVFIDDIDRLSYQEIGTLFQLIKNIADFPGIIYVLAYDKEVVINALEQVQKRKGTDYLQKVVQVSYNIPMPRTRKLTEYLFCQLENINKNNYQIYIQHLRSQYDIYLQYFLKNLRDCNRLYNAFYVKYSLCGYDCNTFDLLAITVLEIFEPRVHQIIRMHKYYMLAETLLEKNLTNEHKNELNLFYKELIEAFSKNNQPYAENLIKVLFPKFYLIAVNKYNDEHLLEINDTDIANRNAFDRYFSLSVDDNEIAEKELIEFMNQPHSVDFIQKQIKEWIKANKIIYFCNKETQILKYIEENAIIADITDEILINYFEAISLLDYDDYRLENGYYVFKSEVRNFIKGLTLVFIKRHRSDSSEELAIKSLFNNDKINCSVLFCVLETVNTGYEWKYNISSRENMPQLLAKKDIEYLKIKLISRIEKESSKNEFFFEPLIYDLLNFWEDNKKSTYQSFIEINRDASTIDAIAFRSQLCVNMQVKRNNIRKYVLVNTLVEDTHLLQYIDQVDKWIETEKNKKLTTYKPAVQRRLAALHLMWRDSKHQRNKFAYVKASASEVQEYLKRED